MTMRERSLVFGEDYQPHPSGLWVPPDTDGAVPLPEDQPIGVDLFAGAGGFSCGMKMGGFHVAAAAEGWACAACTYLINLGGPHTVVHLMGEALPEGNKRESKWFAAHAGESVDVADLFEICRTDFAPGEGWIAGANHAQPCEHLYLGDIRALTGDRILDDLGLTGDDIGAVFGGPPCQGFSRAGERKPDDPRNELVFEFMRVVCEVHPMAFLMENVPGMLDMVTKEGVPVIDAIALMAEEGGMGTFEALRRSVASMAGVGGSLRTQRASAKKRRPGSQAPTHRLEIDPDPVDEPQLAMEMA